MPLTWVLVTGPDEDKDEKVFVNGNTEEEAGLTHQPFRVQVGENTFALKSGKKVTHERTVKVPKRLKADPFDVDLSTASPPAQ